MPPFQIETKASSASRAFEPNSGTSNTLAARTRGRIADISAHTHALMSEARESRLSAEHDRLETAAADAALLAEQTMDRFKAVLASLDSANRERLQHHRTRIGDLVGHTRDLLSRARDERLSSEKDRLDSAASDAQRREEELLARIEAVSQALENALSSRMSAENDRMQSATEDAKSRLDAVSAIVNETQNFLAQNGWSR